DRRADAATDRHALPAPVLLLTHHYPHRGGHYDPHPPYPHCPGHTRRCATSAHRHLLGRTRDERATGRHGRTSAGTAPSPHRRRRRHARLADRPDRGRGRPRRRRRCPSTGPRPGGAQGTRHHRLTHGPHQATSLPDSPEAYRAALPKQFRTNLRGAAKRLTAEGVTHQAVRGQAVPQRLDTLRELHRSQWGSRSSFLPVFDRFAAGFAGGCDADEVAVHELGNDGLVVAIVAVFEVAGRVSVYQSARLTDGRWRDAATFLLAAIIDDACARGFSEVDFLRGDEPYKGRFAPNHREM